MKKEYSHLLEEVISLENVRMGLWTNKLKRLEKYFSEHKEFPTGRRTSITRDVRQVRESYKSGTLPQFVYDKLKELGFIFEYKQNTYEQIMELFIKFVEENNGKLPTNSTNRYLRKWLTHQRTKYRQGRLEKERIHLFRMQEAATGLSLLPTLIITQTKHARRA